MRDYDPTEYYRRKQYPQPRCVNRGIENVIVFPDNQAVEGEHVQRLRKKNNEDRQ